MKLMSNNRFIKYWVPVIIYAALIFISSSISRPPIEVKIRFFDKVLHLASYGILGWLLLRALFNYQYAVSRSRLLFIAIVAATLYGISDEFHQYFVPGRTACISDAIFNFFGAIIGTFIYKRVY